MPRPGEVVVAVRAAGVTFVDALLAQGQYQLKPPLPFTPGVELSGHVVRAGAGFEVGDRVLGTPAGGALSEFAVPAAMARRLPPALSFGQGATLVQSYATALFALTRRTTVSAGDWMLVLGAGGGVGLAMVDVARHLGARVIAAASSDEKLAAAQAAGAEAGVRYDREDLKARVREISGGGVDFVADPVGGAQAEPALRTLRPFGQYLVLGFAAGAIPSLKANPVLLQNRTVVGVDGGADVPAPERERRADRRGARARCLRRDPPERAHPLERAGEALQAARPAGGRQGRPCRDGTTDYMNVSV